MAEQFSKIPTRIYFYSSSILPISAFNVLSSYLAKFCDIVPFEQFLYHFASQRVIIEVNISVDTVNQAKNQSSDQLKVYYKQDMFLFLSLRTNWK